MYYLNHSNRPVRTRMPGGVGGAQLIMAAPYPDSVQTWSAAGSYSFFSERVSSSSSLTTALTPAAATSTVVPTTVAPTLTVVATTLTAASATVTTAQALSIAVAATSSKFLAGWCMVLECNNPRSDKTGNGGYGIRCCAAGKACSGGCGYSNSMMT